MEYLTRNEVAKMLRVHPRTVDRWLKKGLLKAYKLGDGKTAPLRISQKAVDKFLKNNEYGK